MRGLPRTKHQSQSLTAVARTLTRTSPSLGLGLADEVGIREVGISVRVGEFHGLDEDVHIVGAVVTHGGEIERLQDVEHHQQGRPLTVEGLLVNRVAPVGGRGRLFDARKELREILEHEGRTVLLEKGDHFLSDVSLVEAIASSYDARLASIRLRRSFRLDHTGQRACQTGKGDRLARFVK